MNRALTLGLALLATAASATELARATVSPPPAEGEAVLQQLALEAGDEPDGELHE